MQLKVIFVFPPYFSFFTQYCEFDQTFFLIFSVVAVAVDVAVVVVIIIGCFISRNVRTEEDVVGQRVDDDEDDEEVKNRERKRSVRQKKKENPVEQFFFVEVSDQLNKVSLSYRRLIYK